MSTYNIVHHRVVTTRWEGIEANTLEEAIQCILDKSGENGEEDDTDPGTFYQEGWDQEHTQAIIVIRGGNLEEVYSFGKLIDYYLVDMDNLVNGEKLDPSCCESVIMSNTTPEAFIEHFNKKES